MTTLKPIVSGGRRSATSRRIGRRQQMDKIRDRLWSVQDVADYLGIPPRTLYNWRCRGIGPRARRIGRYLRYEEHDVRAWFSAQGDTVR